MDTKDPFSHPEAREVLRRYIEDEGLVDPDQPGMVILDPRLCDALYALSKKELAAGLKQEPFPLHDSKKNLYSRWDSKLELYLVHSRILY